MISSPHSLADVLADPLVSYYISVVMIMVPAVRILQRAGLKSYYAAALLVPWFGAVIFAAVLALNRWPALPAMPKRSRKKKGEAA